MIDMVGGDGRDDAGFAEVLKAEAFQAALPALQHPHPLALFEESCRGMGLGGNLALAKTVYLAATTRVIDRARRLQAHTHVAGPASSGKSFETDAALRHLPQDSVVRFDGCSPRALIYSEKSMAHRVLMYSEMDSLPSANGDDDASNTALSYLRTLVVNGTASYEVVIKVKDGFATRTYTKEGPAVLLVTGRSGSPTSSWPPACTRWRSSWTANAFAPWSLLRGVCCLGRNPTSPTRPSWRCKRTFRCLPPSKYRFRLRSRLAAPSWTPRGWMTRGSRESSPRSWVHGGARDLERRAPWPRCWRRDHRHHRGLRRRPRGHPRAVYHREFSKFAMGVWDTVLVLHKQTGNAVSIADVKKKLLKDHSAIRKAFGQLLAGGTLEDRRERKTQTAPYLVVPVGDSPSRVLLPDPDDIAPAPRSKPLPQLEQADIGQAISIGTEAKGLGTEASTLDSKDLPPLRYAEPGVYRHSDGVAYHEGDVLPDGRRVIDTDGPILTKLKAPPCK